MPMIFVDRHTRRDKRLLRLERELCRLWHAQWHAPIVPLERPYQRGWIKTFTLREDALHHPEVLVFRAVLPVVNQRLTSRRREFTARDGSVHVLRPRIIGAGEWQRLAWPISHQRLFAYGQWELEEIFPWTERCYRKSIRGFRLIRTWWLEEMIEPLMITHQRVELPEVRSRIAEIEAHFTHTLGRERLDRLHGRRARWHSRQPPSADQRHLAGRDDELD